MAQTINFNGVEMTMEMIQAKMAELKSLQGLQKEAKKAGLIVKTAKVAGVKSASYTLLVGNFAPVLSVNKETIETLFKEHVGQDSVSLDVTEEYFVILRSKKVMKDKAATRAAEAKAAADNAKAETEFAAELAALNPQDAKTIEIKSWLDSLNVPAEPTPDTI